MSGYTERVFKSPHEHPLHVYERTSHRVIICNNPGCSMQRSNPTSDNSHRYFTCSAPTCTTKICYMCAGMFVHPLHKHSLIWRAPCEFHCTGAHQLSGCASSMRPFSVKTAKNAWCPYCDCAFCELCIEFPKLPLIPQHSHPLINEKYIDFSQKFCVGRFPGIGYVHSNKKLPKFSDCYSCLKCHFGPICSSCISYVPPKPCAVFDV